MQLVPERLGGRPLLFDAHFLHNVHVKGAQARLESDFGEVVRHRVLGTLSVRTFCFVVVRLFGHRGDGNNATAPQTDSHLSRENPKFQFQQNTRIEQNVHTLSPSSV